MEPYAVRPYSGQQGDLDIATLFWGAVIFLAVCVSCLLARKAIERLYDRGESDGVAPGEPKDPWEQAISRPPADHNHCSVAGEFGGLGGMNRREQEELLLFCGTRKQQNAIKMRRKAAMAGMSQVQRDEFLLIHGSRAERKAIKERRKARQRENH